MGFKEVDERLNSEFIAAVMMINDGKDYLLREINDASEGKAKTQYLEEVYNFLKSAVINNYIVKGYIKQIVCYNMIYMLINSGQSTLEIDFTSILKKFLEDKDFGIELLRIYYLVSSNAQFYQNQVNNFSAEDKSKIEQFLRDDDEHIVDIMTCFRNLIYSLYYSYINEGYSEDEAIELVYIYFFQNGISPIIIDEYMPYQSFLLFKDKFLNIIKSDARSYLEGKIKRSEFQDYVLKYLILVVDCEQFECYKEEIFRIFIENLKRIFGKPRF